MSEFLLVHYKPGQTPGLQYWALGADLHPSITLGHGDLQELKSIARGKKVFVLIDAHYLTLEAINFPSKSRTKQLQAAPYAMEDHLADDIDDTHFALGKAEDENNVPVIAIQRHLLQDILDLFSQQQIHVDVMSADSVALPGSVTQWCILLDEDNALIKTGPAQAQSCDRNNLLLILQALVEQTKNPPESIHYYFKKDDDQATAMLDEIGIPIEPHTYQNHALEIFVRHLKEAQSVNLLQGEFAQKREQNSWFQPWKSVAVLALVWMVIQLAYASLLASQLEDKNQLLARQIETEFKRAVPDAKKMSNIQKRIERRLSDLRGSSNAANNSGFLQILSKVSPILVNNDKLDIKAAVYRNNYIDVDLTAKTLQDIEQVKTKLNALPGINTVLSTTVEKDTVKGRLRLEAKG